MSRYFSYQVHKTGSTTFHNILVRFGLRHHLKTALFTSEYGKPHPHTCRPELLFEIINPSKFTPYNIVCDHATFNEVYPFVYMPPDTVSLALIREPFARLGSAFRYFGAAKLLNLTSYEHPLYEFLLRWQNYQQTVFTYVNKTIPRPRTPFGTQNTQILTFGWKPDQSTADDYIKYLDSKFDLILTQDRLFESLVLLKRKYHWTLQDILHTVMNQGNTKKGKKPQVPEDIERLSKAKAIDRQFSNADYKLYEHFSRKLETLINEQSEDFQDEVSYFQELNANLSEPCTANWTHFRNKVYGQKPSRPSIMEELRAPLVNIPASKWNDHFVISLLDCRLMRIDTLHYHNALRIRQFPRTCGRQSGPSVRPPIYKNHMINKSWCMNDTEPIFNFSLEQMMEFNSSIIIP